MVPTDGISPSSISVSPLPEFKGSLQHHLFGSIVGDR
jgi:hypothetical protein